MHADAFASTPAGAMLTAEHVKACPWPLDPRGIQPQSEPHRLDCASSRLVYFQVCQRRAVPQYDRHVAGFAIARIGVPTRHGQPPQLGPHCCNHGAAGATTLSLSMSLHASC